MLEASGTLGDGTSRRRTGQRARRCTTRFQELERRKLLSSTTLVWDVGVSLPSARGAPAAYSGPNGSVVAAIIVAGCQTPGDPTAVNELCSLSSWWASDSNIDIGRVGPGLVSTPQGLLMFGAGGPSGSIVLDVALLCDSTDANTQDAPTMLTPRKQFAYAADASGQAYATVAPRVPNRQASVGLAIGALPP
jgi:hypothetical protein